MRKGEKVNSQEGLAPPRPFLKWVGGKRQLMPELLARVPEVFNRYFEPMVGGGALFFALSSGTARGSSPGYLKAFLSDVNEELINAYRVVQSNVQGLVADLKCHRHDEDYFYEVRGKDRFSHYKKWGGVKRASRLIYLNKTCYNGLYRVNSQGYFNAPFGDYKNPKIVDEDNLLQCSKVLQDVVIELAPFAQAVRACKKNDFVYFDPPYAPLNATSNFTQYSKDGFSEAMQLELRDTCLELHDRGVFFMLSNSSAPIIRELYKDFNVSLVNARRHVNSVASKRGHVKEVIITNY